MTVAKTSSTKTNLEWDEGFMNVNKVGIDSILGEIEGKKKSKTEHSLEDTSSIINLFTPNQKFLNVSIAPGNYSNVKIRVDIAQTVSAPALFLKGKFTDNNDNLIPVEFSLNEGDINSSNNDQQNGNYQGGKDNGLEILALANSLNVDTQNIATATVNVDFKLLFNGVRATDFEAATQVNGKIIINKTSNSTLYNLIKTNINKFSKID
ncbi:MAG: hypothetical protein KJ712_04465 [Bacteroidetes bacterium]|nr:hypothetical protein [Bacteroidota bacterium]